MYFRSGLAGGFYHDPCHISELAIEREGLLAEISGLVVSAARPRDRDRR